MGGFACAAPSGIYQNKADLLGDVVQRIGRVDGEANQNDVRIGVRQGTETVVVLLAGRIPERQLDVSAIDLDIGDVVLKHGRDVDLVPRALVCGSAVSKHGWFDRVQRDGESRIELGPCSDNQAGCCKAERGRRERECVITGNQAFDERGCRRGTRRGGKKSACIDGDAVCHQLTSGKVPLEKTLRQEISKGDQGEEAVMEWIRVNLHQQAGLSASTIANDDELPAEFSRHGCWDPMGGAWLGEEAEG